MFWNSRGLRTEILDILATMREQKAAVTFIFETRIYNEDMSEGEFKWFRGPEKLPSLGGAEPRRGIGAWVDSQRFPDAAIAFRGIHSLWISLNGSSGEVLHVGGTHWPMMSDSDRGEAVLECTKQAVKFRKMGRTILGGDFNSRTASNGDSILSGCGKQLLAMGEESNLALINSYKGLCPDQFTRRQETRRCGSLQLDDTTIDYVLTDYLALQAVVCLEFIQNDNLDSDHKPLLLTTTLQGYQRDYTAGIIKPLCKRRIKFEGRSDQLHAAFEDRCEPDMVRLCSKFQNLPASLTQMNIDDCATELTEALASSAELHYGVKHVGPHTKPWFDAEVKSLFNIKNLARRVLLVSEKWRRCGHQSAERHHQDALAVFKKTKRLLRSLIRAKHRSRQRRTFAEIERASGNSKLYWSLWKKKTQGVSEDTLPETVRNENGGLELDPGKVKGIWANYIRRLGSEPKIGGELKDSSDRAEFDDPFAEKIADYVRASLSPNGTLPELVNPISWAEVHSAILRLPNGKNAGPDHIPNEILRLAGLGFEVVLTNLLNAIWKSGLWPTRWQVATLIPLYKKDGDLSEPSNYRMLAMMNTLPKVFEKILDTRIRAWSERVGALSDLQGGFREGRSTTDQIFILNEILTSRKEEGVDTFACFIDIAKAYDRVWRPGLWYKLNAAGLDRQTLAVLQCMFRKVVRRVLVHGELSDEFEVQAGVPQGSVLSPILYASYIDGLHEQLRQAGVGVLVFGRLVPLLMYADDICVLASDAASLEQALRIIEDYARRWRFKINHGKSNVVVFGSKKARAEAEAHYWLLAGEPIPVSSSYKYLGLDFTNGTRGKWNAFLSRIYTKARSSSNLVAFLCGGADGANPRTAIHQWAARVRPQLEYACAIWDGEESSTWTQKLEGVLSVFGRAVLALKSNPASIAVRAELGVPSMKSRRQYLKLGFWKKLCDASTDRLLAHVFRHRYAQVVAGRGRWSCLQTFRTTLLDFGYAHLWQGCTAPGALHDWKAETRSRVDNAWLLRQRREMATKTSLSLYSQLGHDFTRGSHPYLDDRSNILGTRIKTYLRLGTTFTMQRIACTLDWPEAGGQCVLCKTGEIEDTCHLFVTCPAVREHMRQFLAILHNVMPQAGTPGKHVADLVSSSCPERTLQIIAGADVDFPAGTVNGADAKRYVHECVRASWLLDKLSKNYLARCWKAREGIIGTLKIKGGRLLRDCVEVRLQAPSLTSAGCMYGRDSSWMWRSWFRYLRRDVRRCWSGGPWNFYVVTEGRHPGIFYRWLDAKASITGVDGRCYGYNSLAEAEAAYTTAVVVWM